MNQIKHHWDACLLATHPTEYIEPWLAKPYIISKAMKQCARQLNCTLLQQGPDILFADEISALNLGTPEALVRKVYLKGDGVPWSFGRVIVPEPTYLAYQSAFDGLGGKLIGETLLYGNPKTTRGPFSYIRLTRQDALYQDMFFALDDHYPEHCHLDKEEVWGRRSIFNIDGYPLMVQEAYFPWIPPYPRESHDH